MTNATNKHTDVTFSLTTSELNNRHTINIHPLKTNDSFQFLGVWFNIEHSNKFVIQQITHKYNRFITLLDLIYLHNSILIPRTDYRMQVTPLTEAQCSSIISKYRILIKKKLL